MMMIESERFGRIEVLEEEIINFPSGVVGFPDEKAFVLVRNGRSGLIGWMQSVTTPDFAFPVVSAHGFGEQYPDVEMDAPAQAAGVWNQGAELAVLAVLSAPRRGPATVNLMAPIVVNAATRMGAQVMLEGTRFSTRELYVIPRTAERETEPAPPPSSDSDVLENAAVPAE